VPQGGIGADPQAGLHESLTRLPEQLVPALLRNPSGILHEIQSDALCGLLNSIDLSGMMAFHTRMDNAWRSRLTPEVPPFPKHAAYGMVRPVIDWISRERFNQVVDAINVSQRIALIQPRL